MATAEEKSIALNLTLDELIMMDKAKLVRTAVVLGITNIDDKTSSQRLIQLIHKFILSQTEGTIPKTKTNVDPNLEMFQTMLNQVQSQHAEAQRQAQRQHAESQRLHAESMAKITEAIQAGITRPNPRANGGATGGASLTAGGGSDQQHNDNHHAAVKITVRPPPQLEADVTFSKFKAWEIT